MAINFAENILQGKHSSYKLGAMLGSGGMALVYHATDMRTSNPVAIKMMYDWLANSTETISRFYREIKIISALSHPHIVPIIDSGEYNNRPFMVMPYYQSGSLASYIQNNPEVTVGQSLIWLSQIASALEYAHPKKVIHRDLKLENFLMQDASKILLSDFGMAHIADATRLTFTGDLRGTPLLISPEQVRGDKHLDSGIDIYALSVVAYLLFTGYFPFMSSDTLAIINMHASYPPPTPTEVNPNLPEAVDKVLLKGLAKTTQDRYQSAQDLITDLDHALNEHIMLPVIVDMDSENPIPLKIDTIVLGSGKTSIDAPIPKNKNVESPKRPNISKLVVVLALVVALLGSFYIAVGRDLLQADPLSVASVLLDATATPTLTQTATEQPTETSTQTPTEEPSPTQTSTSTPTVTNTVVPTSTPTVTMSPTTRSIATLAPLLAQPTRRMLTTPTHTPTPLPGLPAEISGQQGANIRTGANDGYSIVTYLEKDTEIWLVGRNYQASWFQAIMEDERQGWLFGSLIDYGDADVLTLPITWVDPPTSTPVPPTPVPVMNNNNGGGGNNNGGNNNNNGGGGGEESNDNGENNVVDDVVDTVKDIVGGLLP